MVSNRMWWVLAGHSSAASGSPEERACTPYRQPSCRTLSGRFWSTFIIVFAYLTRKYEILFKLHHNVTTRMAHPFVANSHVLHRAFAAHPKRIVRTDGIRLILESGQGILDASAGPSVSCLGHSRPDIAQAVAEQLMEVPYVYSGSCFTSTATEQLATHLLRDRPGGLSKAIFVNSGSEATDAALKLAFQYWREADQPQKRFVIARKQSYHGNTIGALCVSGHDSRRALYNDWLSNNVRFVDPCFAYRFKRPGESDEMYVQRLSNQLEDQILELGPGNVAAFIAETVSGTTLGCATATEGYFKAVRALCDKYDILLILDEVCLKPLAAISCTVKYAYLTFVVDHVWHGQNWNYACVGAGGNSRPRHSNYWQSSRRRLHPPFSRAASPENI